jgi:hypothetical protein
MGNVGVQKYNCWTWYADWEWFEEESFIKDDSATPAPHGKEQGLCKALLL